MDLSTTYLGFKLPHPLIPGACPLADTVDGARRLEDAGAPLIVLRSLFEEQIVHEQMSAYLSTESHGESFAEATSYFPSGDRFVFGPEEYLEHLHRVKVAVDVPVVASLNGTTPGGWLDYPPLLQRMGADALELNLYQLALDPDLSGGEVEALALQAVREVRRSVRIPIAVKLSPFYSSFANFAMQVDRTGADALVLFNRFYQPDLDPEDLSVKSEVHLSTPEELPLRLRWIAALAGRVNATLALTGGIHSGRDGVKAVMAGAHVAQVVSALLQHGPERLRGMVQEMERFLDRNEWESLTHMRGSLSLQRCPDPSAYERANYMLLLQTARRP